MYDNLETLFRTPEISEDAKQSLRDQIENFFILMDEEARQKATNNSNNQKLLVASN